MKRYFLSTLCFSFLILTLVTAQSTTRDDSNAPFEGKIHFKKTSGALDMKYNYYVKADIVRLEELNEVNEVVGIQLINNAENQLTAVSPERKLYLEAPPRRSGATLTVKVVKTEKKKEILGLDCFEVIVINQEQDRKIVYWLTEGNYNFFKPMLKILNRKEKQAMYFLEIKGEENCWPVKSIEYVISTGKVLSKLVTLSIENGPQSASLFEIPEGYTKFEN